MKELTPRQAEILQLIRDTIEETGFPPTRVEIARMLGFASPNAAEEHLRALERKGAIEILDGTARGIRAHGGARPAARRPGRRRLADPRRGAHRRPLLGRPRTSSARAPTICSRCAA